MQDAGAFAGSVLVGLVSGYLSGMFGVGGAVISTPGIRALGASPLAAVGSTVPAIVPGSVAGALRYLSEGFVDLRVSLVCGSSGAAAAFVGSLVADAVDARWLMVATAVLVGRSGLRLLVAETGDGESLDASEKPADESHRTAVTQAQPEVGRSEPSLLALVGVGIVAGFLAGLLGVGGGIVLLPAFSGLLHLDAKTTVASSLVAVAIFSIPSLVGHWWLGHIDWTYAGGLVVGVVPGARLGSSVTVRRSERQVRRWLGLFFLAVAVVYGGGELAAILG